MSEDFDAQRIVDRLVKSGSRKYQDGFRAGVGFAKEEADLDDFEFFEKNPEEVFGCDSYMINRQIGYAVLGEETRPARYVLGFIEGVQSVWKEIQPIIGDIDLNKLPG